MAFDGWQERLWAAIEADTRTPRAISLEAKLGPNYLSQLKAKGHSPSLDNALKICDVLSVSFLKILTGLDIDADGQELLTIAGQMSPSRRRSLIATLRPDETPAPEQELASSRPARQ